MGADDVTDQVPLVELAIEAEARRLASDAEQHAEQRRDSRLSEAERAIDRLTAALHSQQMLTREILNDRSADHERFQRQSDRMTRIETGYLEIKDTLAGLKRMFAELDEFTHKVAAEFGDRQ